MPTAEIAAAAAAAVDFSHRRTQSKQAARLSKKWQSIARFSRQNSRSLDGEKRSSILNLMKPVATTGTADTAAPAVVHPDGRPRRSSLKTGGHGNAVFAGGVLSASGPPRPATAPQPTSDSGLADEAASMAAPTQMSRSWTVQPAGNRRAGTGSGRSVSFSPAVPGASAAEAASPRHGQDAAVTVTTAEGCPQEHLQGPDGSRRCLSGSGPGIASGSVPSNPPAGPVDVVPRQHGEVHAVEMDGVVEITTVEPLGDGGGGEEKRDSMGALPTDPE